jgi:hypothetical protein
MPGRAQTHKAGLVPGGLDRTKMVHVKHFGTIGAKNLTRRQTAAPRSICKIDQFFGAVPVGRLRCLDGLTGLREVIPDVRFADRIEVVTRDARAAATWSCPSQVSAVTDRIFLHRNYAPKQKCALRVLATSPT